MIASIRHCLNFSIISLYVLCTSAKAEGNNRWHMVANEPSQMSQGGAGLIQTPTARMSDAGEFSVNYADVNQYRFWSVSAQLFNWFESTVRYTDVRTQKYSPFPGFSGDQTLKDKGIDVKLSLLKESRYLPQVALGFKDFGGTGLFESEYLVLSKKFGDFDVSMGLGWGYLGNSGSVSNPFCSAIEQFCERPTGFTGSGGSLEVKHFFRGDSAIFGGVEYQTPLKPLRVKLEYEGNDYQQDRAGKLKQDSRWNIGATYRLDNFEFGVNYQRGNTLGLNLSYKFNMNQISPLRKERPASKSTDPIKPPHKNNIDKSVLTKDLYYNAGFLLNASKFTNKEATVFGTQLAYADADEAVTKISSVLASQVPESVDTFRIVENKGSVPMVETQVNKKRFIEATELTKLNVNVNAAFNRHEVTENTLNNYEPNNDGGFFTGVETFWNQTFGSPEKFYFYQGGVLLNGGYAFGKNLSLIGNAKVTLLENYDDFKFKVDNQNTPLPRVRTQVREYVSGKRITLDSLFVNWNDRLASNMFGQLYAGYLETMFAGVGAEYLYQPVDSNLSFGFDVNYVQQRSFEDDLSLSDYTAVTGHANIYWEPEFLENTLLTFNIGQFLAKDKGVKIDFAKRFDSGVVIGAYAAFTNVSAAEYGEGSFTKGFYMSLPLDLFTLSPSKGKGTIPWSPISRDGGQTLERPIKLFDLTSPRRKRQY